MSEVNSVTSESHHESRPIEIFLCHFGGPEKAEEVSPFLYQLFMDPFIIRAPFPPFFRKWLANKIVKKRGEESLAQYQRIGFSPINKYTQAQAELLEEKVRSKHPNAVVKVVNRYTEPFAGSVCRALEDKPIRRFVMTLYPHFCHSTTVSSIRDFSLALRERFGEAEVPRTEVYNWWHNPKFMALSEAYLIESLAEAVSKISESITILFSAHGIPKRYALRGDPYPNEIKMHYQRLREVGEAWLAKEAPGRTVHWQLSFQSRVGRMEWIKPYTETEISRLAQQNGGHLLLVPISFVSDHIETLFEMDVTYQEDAKQNGFSSYSRVPGFNEDPKLAEALFDVLESQGL